MIFKKRNNDLDYEDDILESKFNLIDFILKYKLFFLIGIIVIVIITVILIIFKNNQKEIIQYYLSLNGEEYITLYKDSEYIDEGCIAYDNKGNNLSSEIVVSSNVDTSNVGEYQIVYKIHDVIKYRSVYIVEKPIGATYIHLLGDSIIYLKINEKYKEPGYLVTDTVDSNLKDKVKITSNINSKEPGIYKVTYTVTNSSGVTTSASRKVIVMSSDTSLSLDNSEPTNKEVGINIHIVDNYFDYLLLPNKEKITSKDYTYKVSENGTYKFTIYNKKSGYKEVSIDVDNIVLSTMADEEIIKCDAGYNNGYGLAYMNITSGTNKVQKFEFISDNKVIKSGMGLSYQAVENRELLVRPSVRVTYVDGSSNVGSCNFRKSNYFAYKKEGYYFSKGNSMDYEGIISNPYPKNRIAYYVHIPKNASVDTQIPVIFALHGGYGFGVSCNGSTTSEANQTHHFLKTYYKYSYKEKNKNKKINNIGNGDYDINAIIIAPSNMSCQWPNSIDDAMDVLYAYVKLYNVNIDDIIVTGTSQGGYGTYDALFMEEHIIEYVNTDTSLSTIAKKYNVSTSYLISYNKDTENIKFYLNGDIVKAGSKVYIREKNENERSLFALGVPMSAAADMERTKFMPNSLNNVRYEFKTPIWIFAANDEYKAIQDFAKTMANYYVKKNKNFRYTMLQGTGHNTQIQIFGLTEMADYMTSIKKGNIDLNNDERVKKIENDLGKYFLRTYS